jgi:hypothetical protein
VIEAPLAGLESLFNRVQAIKTFHKDSVEDGRRRIRREPGGERARSLFP